MSQVYRETPAILLAGGREMDAQTTAEALSLLFRKIDRPKVAYIGAANGDREAFFERICALLLQAGADMVDFVRLAQETIDIDAGRAMLSAADVIFIAGGEVEDGMIWLQKHGLVSLLKSLYTEGRQFIGMSAGTIMLGTHWVRWDNPEDIAEGELFDCLGIIPAVFDTHAEDEDWIELKTALRLLGEGSHGYGLPGGCIISADSSGQLINRQRELLTFFYQNGEFELR